MRRKAGSALADFDEKDLIARLRRSELEAMADVFRRYGDAMTTLAVSMLRDGAEADDVVEDALLRIHAAGPGFRGERGLKTWSLRVVANLCRDRLRRRKFVAGSVDDLDASRLAFEPVADWDEAMDQRVMARALEAAVDRLPDDQRETLLLRYRLGLSHEDISSSLGVPEGTVKSRLSRAVAALRKAMEDWRP